jgi:sterol 14-demethylase
MGGGNGYDWKVVAGCSVVAAAGLWSALGNLSFALKNRNKKLPPVYSEWGCLPIVGAAIPFLIDPLALARRAEAKCGDCFTIYIFGKRITFLSGPDAQENFCKARDDELSQQEAYKYVLTCFLFHHVDVTACYCHLCALRNRESVPLHLYLI